MSEEKIFGTPNMEADKKAVEEEGSKKIDWKKKTYKPKPAPAENTIRVLPPLPGKNYYAKGAKHFIRHGERDWESFTCNRITYPAENLRCPACENFVKFIEEGKKKEAEAFRPKKLGVFNVVDRMEQDKEYQVKIYEAPITVWQTIVELRWFKENRYDLFDTVDESGKIRYGRDIEIQYRPDADFSKKYLIQAGEEKPLAENPEEMKKLVEQAFDLDLEVRFPKEDPTHAEIKIYGNQEERKQLKEILKQMAAKDDDEEPEVDEGGAEIKTSEEAGEKKEEPKPEPEKKEEPKPEPEKKEEPKPEPEKKEEPKPEPEAKEKEEEPKPEPEAPKQEVKEEAKKEEAAPEADKKQNWGNMKAKLDEIRDKALAGKKK